MKHTTLEPRRKLICICLKALCRMSKRLKEGRHLRAMNWRYWTTCMKRSLTKCYLIVEFQTTGTFLFPLMPYMNSGKTSAFLGRLIVIKILYKNVNISKVSVYISNSLEIFIYFWLLTLSIFIIFFNLGLWSFPMDSNLSKIVIYLFQVFV